MLLIYILIIGVIAWAVIKVLEMLGAPAELQKLARIIIFVIAVLLVILLLLQFVGALSIPFVVK